jgi:hypothetical protein
LAAGRGEFMPSENDKSMAAHWHSTALIRPGGAMIGCTPDRIGTLLQQ